MNYDPHVGGAAKAPPINKSPQNEEIIIDLSQQQISENHLQETSSSPSKNSLLKKDWKQETPYGPTSLTADSTLFHYPTVNPAITKLEVVTLDAYGKKQYHELAREGDGFKSILDIPAGALYRLRFTYADNRVDEVVDPAAPYLPNGVLHHADEKAWGQIWDQAAYEFKHERPQGDLPTRPVCSVFHVGIATKEGTFQAAKEMLPKLKEQGIDVIQLMPVGAVVGDFNWGYDAVPNLFSVNRNYGTPDDMKSFIDEAHRLGLRVVLDVVYNHLSSDVVSQEYLLGKEIVDYNAKDSPWGKKLDFNNPALRDYVLRNIDFWSREFNVDGFRIDAAWAVHEKAIMDICEHARSYIPNAMIAYEGCTRFCKELQEVIKLGYFDNEKNFVYDTGLLWVSTVAAFLPPEEREGFYREIGIDYKNGNNNIDWAHTTSDLAKIEWNSLIGLCHDYYGNRANCDRIMQHFKKIFGDTDGYMATKALFSIIMATPGAKMIFCGDESGAMDSPFAYFKQGLNKEAEMSKARDRIHEWPDFFISRESEKGIMLGDNKHHPGWDGSAEQLKQFYHDGQICKKTFEQIYYTLPHRPELFEKAKLSSSDLESAMSKAWQRAFKEIVGFSTTLKPAKHLSVSAHGDSMLLLEGLTDKDGNEVCMVVNMTDRDDRLHLGWSGICYDKELFGSIEQHRCEIIHTTADDEYQFENKNGETVQTNRPIKVPYLSEEYNDENELERFLNLPPHGVAYIKRTASNATMH